jgi:hypothetical protein
LAPNHPQRVVVAVRPPLPQDQVQSVAGVRQNKHQDKHVESDDPKRALQGQRHEGSRGESLGEQR